MLADLGGAPLTCLWTACPFGAKILCSPLFFLKLMHCSKCLGLSGMGSPGPYLEGGLVSTKAAIHGWKCVAGPVAAMVQYCLDLRINVSDPLRWVHSSGVLLLDVTNPGLFLSVRRFLTNVVALERAARFGAVAAAQGAQEGVDWSVHRKLLKASGPPSPRWAFHAVWQGRVLHSDNGGFSHCACGAANTLHHVYYECPLSTARLSPALRNFQRKHQDPCFWLRGMVPRAWTTPPVSSSWKPGSQAFSATSL